VSPEERSLIMALVVAPGHREVLSEEEFLREFGAADGAALGLDLLRVAIDRHDPVDVEFALVVCGSGRSYDRPEGVGQRRRGKWRPPA
jgi:hypothetical protein